MTRSAAFFRAITVACALLIAACPKQSTTPDKEPECSEAKACLGGLVCVEGVCSPCQRDRECGRTEFCHPLERRCQMRPCYGDQCSVHDDCQLGEFCVQGLCLNPSQSHPKGCLVLSCAEGETCNEGERCHPTNLVCEEDLGCGADSDCAPSERCNVGSGACELACTPENAVELCGVRRVCDDGICVDCTRDDDCGGGLTCDTKTRTCVSSNSCRSNADCVVPLVCNRLTNQCTESVPPCLSADDCLPGETCQLSTGRCVSASCVADRFEPNDQLPAARAIAIGTTKNLTLCAGDVDLFTLPLARGDRLLVVAEVDVLVPFSLAILDPTGAAIATGNLSVDATVAVAGDHYVRATSTDAYVRYGLRLALSRGVPCDADDGEPNESWVQATPIGPGDHYGLSLCPGDEDWYTVSVPFGQRLEVDLLSTALSGDLDLELYDSDGRRLLAASATPDDVERVSAAGFSGSRAYVRVKGASRTVQNRYDLSVRLR